MGSLSRIAHRVRRGAGIIPATLSLAILLAERSAARAQATASPAGATIAAPVATAAPAATAAPVTTAAPAATAAPVTTATPTSRATTTAAPVTRTPAPSATPTPLPTPTPTPIVYPEPRGALDSAIRDLATQGAPVDGAAIDGPLLVDLYGPRAWAPLWTAAKDKDLRPRIASVLEQIRRAGEEGLDPAWYHPKQIEHLVGASTDAQKAQLEILLSDAVMHYAAHVRDGAFRPDKRTGDGWVPPSDLDPTQVAEEAARSADPGSYLATFVPTDPIYVRFRDEFARHREASSGKGLPPIADGPKLALGSKSPRVKTLRAHLEATGDLRPADPATDPEAFDEDVKAALEAFQKRHGLAVDGVVTTKTRAALNGGAGQGRARQLQIAMEKFRWLPRDMGERHVFINIPEQRLHLRDGGRSELEMNVVVGKPTWQTPEFSAEMSEIVFNPPWNVPPKIAREEVLPRIKSDPSYLKRHDMRVRGRGRTIPLIQQAPGPRNPLGRAKFNFPNGFDVYLHDTPSKGAFRAADRRLSHGCVRVADAKGLAAAILAKDSGGGASRQKAALSTFQTRPVALGEKLPVHIVYFTAWPNDEGEIVYRGDVYRRDAKLDARWGKPRALRKPIPVAPPPVKTDEDDADDAASAGQQAKSPSGPAAASAGQPKASQGTAAAGAAQTVTIGAPTAASAGATAQASRQAPTAASAIGASPGVPTASPVGARPSAVAIVPGSPARGAGPAPGDSGEEPLSP